MKNAQNFTEGKIFGPLIRFAFPILLAMMLQTMYGAVDLLIVGQFGSAADVSAVSTGSRIMNTMTVLITGLSMGLTVLVGRKIGEGVKEEAGEIIGCGIWLFGIMAIGLSVIMVFASRFMSGLMQAPQEAFEQTVAYVRICSFGILFIVAYNLVGSIFRGLGDSKIPLITVAIACVINIFGDLLFVAVFHMGAAGAAIATVAAQAISVVLSLIIIKRKELPFTFNRYSIRPQGRYIRNIMTIGTPIALQDLLVSISFMVLVAIVNSLGLVVSAGVGVADKLCGFIMLVPSAYSQAMSAFVAQNLGAGKPDRARKALFCGISSSVMVGIVMFFVTFFYGDVMAGIFAKDTEVIRAAAEYLKAYAIDTLLVSFLFCFIGYFNGCSCTVFVMLQGLIGAFGVRIPVSYIMSKQAVVSVFHVGLATPASTVVQIILCGIYFAVLLKRQQKQQKFSA